MLKLRGSNVKNEKSHVKKFFIFQLFVNFSTDSDSSEIKFFRTGSKYTYILGSAIKNMGLFSKIPIDFKIETMDF